MLPAVLSMAKPHINNPLHPNMPSPSAIILASTSPYRRALLERLGLAFKVAKPGVDETPQPGEAPEALATRLARAKAMAVAADYPGALIIGSDQVAVLGDQVLGKPGNHENAVRQLRQLSGRSARFLTALCVHHSGSGRTLERLVPFEVTFRPLDEHTIETYLRREQPYDCAASAKAEALGIALIARMQGDDPNALIGLPLIALVDLLQEHGVKVL
jgi:septum formation protein